MSSGAHFDVLSGRLQIDVSKVQPALNSALQGFKNFAANAQRSLEVLHAGINNLGRVVAGLGTAVAGASVALVKLASDANEAASKFGFVFGKAAEETTRKLDEFSKVAGRSKYSLRDMASNIGALIGPMGFTEQKTGELSVAFTKLATDLSSFFNVSEGDALMALRSAIVGESEPMRRFGVQINEAKIQAEAFALGIAKSKAEVQGAIKTQAIFSIIMRETKQAQGDAVRTGDQFANSIRRMNDFIKDAATDIGQAFIPAATKLVRTIGNMADPMKKWAAANQEWLTQNISEAMEWASKAAMQLYETSVRAYQGISPVMAKLWQQAQQLYAGFREWFDSLPAGTQDVLKIVGALTGLSLGLGKIGGSLPIVGGFASAIGALINPFTLLGGAIKFLLPLISGVGGLIPVLGLLFSPAGLIAVGLAGLVALVGYMRGDVAGTFKDVASVIGTAFGGALKQVIKLFKDLRAEVTATMAVKQQNEASEKQVRDRFGDQGVENFRKFQEAQRRLQAHTRAVAEARAPAAPGTEGMSASLRKRIIEEADAAHAKLKADVDAAAKKYRDDGAKFQQRKAEAADAQKFNDRLFSGADKQAKQIADRESQQAEFRGRTAAAGDAAKAVAQGIGSFLSGKTLPKHEEEARAKNKSDIAKLLSEGRIGEAIAKGQVEFERQHASDVAIAQQMVAGAQKNLRSKAPASGQAFQFGAKQQSDNLATLQQNQQDMLSQAGGMSGMQRAMAQQAAAVIGQIGQQMTQAFGKFDALTEGQQQAAVQLHDTYQNLVAQFKAGTLTQKQFNEQVQAAADAANKLADAEDKAAEGKGGQGGGAMGLAQAFDAVTQQMQNVYNAMMAPWNAFQNFMQQLMAPWQQAQAAAQQMADFQEKAAQNPLLNPVGFALQGGSDLQQNLADAIKSGNRAQILDAVQKMKDYANSQIQLTLHNAALATGDIQNISGFGIHAAGTDNANIVVGLANNPQAAATIQQLQGVLANLNKLVGGIPKMAEGGLVTSPTYAMVGERGPEAVIPLARLAQMFGNPMSIFKGIFGNLNNFRVNPGGMAINPLGLNAGNMGAFDNLFQNAGRILNTQFDLGNTGAAGLFQNWMQVQQQAADSLSYMRSRRSINLGGNAGWANGVAPGHTMHFNFGDIHLANGTDEQVASLAQRISDAVRSQGRDMTGRSGLGYSSNGRSSPLAPAGQPR